MRHSTLLAVVVALALLLVVACCIYLGLRADPVEVRARLVGEWRLHTDAPHSRQLILNEDGTGLVSDSYFRGGPRSIAAWSVGPNGRTISIVMARPEAGGEREIGGPFKLRTDGKLSGLVLTHAGGDSPGTFAYLKHDDEPTRPAPTN